MPSMPGALNPNWNGGRVQKTCQICSSEFSARRKVAENVRFCSLQCVGVSQRGRLLKPSTKVHKSCAICGNDFELPRAHAPRLHCCSKACSSRFRSKITVGENNPNWAGGVSRVPYTWNFRHISREIIKRDGGRCRSPECSGTDKRLTTHHIDYDKSNNHPRNLIALCSACNSKANFDRPKWQVRYRRIMARRFRADGVKIKVAADQYPFRFIALTPIPKKDGGGWKVEEF